MDRFFIATAAAIVWSMTGQIAYSGGVSSSGDPGVVQLQCEEKGIEEPGNGFVIEASTSGAIVQLRAYYLTIGRARLLFENSNQLKFSRLLTTGESFFLDYMNSDLNFWMRVTLDEKDSLRRYPATIAGDAKYFERTVDLLCKTWQVPVTKKFKIIN